MRPHGTGAELERRRRLAVARVRSGYTQKEVAQFSAFISAASNAGCRAYRAQRAGGAESQARPGPAAETLARSRAAGPVVVSPLAAVFGFPTELWTAARVAEVIQRKFRKNFHPHYINPVVGGAANHAAEARAASPRARRAEGPSLAARGVAADKKSAARRRAHLVLIDESGFLMSPLVRRTLAPRGQTPILKTKAAHREKVSVAAALTISPRRHRLGLYWRTFREDFVNAERAADFLRGLLAAFARSGDCGLGRRPHAQRRTDPRRSSSTSRDCRWNACHRMLPNSIPSNTCGIT